MPCLLHTKVRLTSIRCVTYSILLPFNLALTCIQRLDLLLLSSTYPYSIMYLLTYIQCVTYSHTKPGLTTVQCVTYTYTMPRLTTVQCVTYTYMRVQLTSIRCVTYSIIKARLTAVQSW